MTAGFWSAFVDGAGRLLDMGGLRAKRGARDPHEAARRAIRDAWATVGGEYWTAVAQERAALDTMTRDAMRRTDEFEQAHATWVKDQH